MKILLYRRHSIKDGEVRDTIGPKGLDLAVVEGRRDLKQSGWCVERVFHGSLVRTAQTALAYLEGQGNSLFIVEPVIEEIGTDALFAEIANDAFRAATKEGASNFDALIAVHGVDKAEEWALAAAKGVTKMFDAMVGDEVAIAFGHSPTIEMAAWAINEYEPLPNKLTALNDMEGIVFLSEDFDSITIGEKISVEK